MAIQSFGDKETQEFFVHGTRKLKIGWKSVEKIVKRKLDMLDYAHRLDDMRSPPGNRLEALKGDWLGWHSIRINDQWRIVFKWGPAGPIGVQITDYH